MRAKNLLISIGVLLFFAGAIGLFLLYFEPVEEEVTSDYSPAAQHNPFLAAERFMDKLDYDVSTSRDRNELDKVLDSDEYDVIITSYSHLFEKPDRRERLMNWMRAGGHLILEVRTNDTSDDVATERPFLNQFGISPISKNPLFENYDDIQTSVQIYQNGTVFQASFLARHSLQVTSDEVTVRSGDKNGTHLVEFDVGEGILTVLSDMELWRNRKIGQLDHAALLAEVLGKSPGRIWLLYYISMPSLMEILWRDASWVVISFIAFLVFFLWSLNNRFGPFITYVKRQRRSLVEHITAAGLFDWRFNQGATLLEGVRGDLLQHIESRHPSWDKKTDSEKVAWICEKTKIPEPQINHALHGDCQTHMMFLHAISTLQTLRKLL